MKKTLYNNIDGYTYILISHSVQNTLLAKPVKTS